MTLRAARWALCLLAMAPQVWASPPVQSPRPMPRPAAFNASAPAAVAPGALLVSISPRLRPDHLLQPKPLTTSLQATQAPLVVSTKQKSGICGVSSIKGQAIKPIRAKLEGCGLKDGVVVTSVSGVALSTPAKIDCTTAKALNAWVEGAVLPSVGKLGGGVAKINIAASYACRARNNRKGGKISEHGKGRAVDISAIVLQNGKVISVLKDWGSGKRGKILKKIRKSACGPFSTVLGPGSDRFHRDHFHFDTARGRGPYCR
ncbi:MAG: extensin family protein [Albidovulum sp.]